MRLKEIKQKADILERTQLSKVEQQIEEENQESYRDNESVATKSLEKT